MANLTKEQRIAKEAEAPRDSTADARIRAEQIRKERTGFGIQQNFDMDIKAPPGWKWRWVNDVNIPGRIKDGFDFVSKSEFLQTTSIGFEGVDVADRITKPNKANMPGGVAGMTTLMKVPMEIAEELIKARVTDPTDRVDQLIRGGLNGLKSSEQDHVYTPKGAPIRYGQKSS